MESSHQRQALCDLSNSKQKFSNTFNTLGSKNKQFNSESVFKVMTINKGLSQQPIIFEENEIQTANKYEIKIEDELVQQILSDFDILFKKEQQKLSDEYQYDSMNQGFNIQQPSMNYEFQNDPLENNDQTSQTFEMVPPIPEANYQYQPQQLSPINNSQRCVPLTMIENNEEQ